MSPPRPDFKAAALAARQRLGDRGLQRLLDEGRRWSLGPTLIRGGSILFPHATLDRCGHQSAAAVHACLDSGADRVVALGVLHARDGEMIAARDRVAGGADPAGERMHGVQGPGLEGRREWEREFSLDGFLALWDVEIRRRARRAPDLFVRYPFLVGDHPERLRGMSELRDLARDAVVVATMDPFHHGRGYGDPSEAALEPGGGGLDLARRRLAESMALLGRADYAGFRAHCGEIRNDGRDVGPVLRHLLGPLTGRVLDLVVDDMSPAYQAASPTWVACALVALEPAAPLPGE